MSASSGGQLWPLLCQRCPRCGRGRLFQGIIRMNERCPECGLLFEREEGYFLGAMYFSYFGSVLLLGIAYAVWSALLPDWHPEWIGLLASLVFLPFVPGIFRYSRTVWIYFDRWAWPGRS